MLNYQRVSECSPQIWYHKFWPITITTLCVTYVSTSFMYHQKGCNMFTQPSVKTFASKSPRWPPCLVHPLHQTFYGHSHDMDETSLKAWVMVGSWKIWVWDTPHGVDGLQTWSFYYLSARFWDGKYALSLSLGDRLQVTAPVPLAVSRCHPISSLCLDCCLTSAFLLMKQCFLVDHPWFNSPPPLLSRSDPHPLRLHPGQQSHPMGHVGG